MKIQELFRGDLVLCITAILFAAMAAVGYKKGLVKMLTSLVSVALSVFLALTATPTLVALMKESNAWESWMENKVLPATMGAGREFIFSALCFIGVFLLSLLVIKILSATLDLIARLPVLNFVNKSLGAVLGLCEATVYVWVFMLLVYALPHVEICADAIREIEGSSFLSFLNDNNMIRAFIQRGIV